MQEKLGLFFRMSGTATVFWTNVALIRFALAENINYEGLVSQEITGLWLFELALGVLALLFLYSTARLFLLQSEQFRHSCREILASTFGDRMRFFLSSWDLYADFAIFSMIWIISALSYGMQAPESGLLADRPWLSALFLVIGLAGFFLTLLLARLGAMRTVPVLDQKGKPDRHGRKRFSARYPIFYFLLLLVRNLVLYVLSAIAFPFVLSMVVGGIRIISVLFVGLWVLIAMLILLPWLGSYIRAYLKRRRFLKRLKAICLENGYIYTEGKNIRSVLRVSEGVDFRLECGSVSYDCKLIPGRKRLVNIAFLENGTGVYIRSFRLGVRLKNRVTVVRVGNGEIFRIESTFRYAFEGDGRKILIVNPVPKNLFVRRNGTSRLIDVGEEIGEYTIYNGSGFLNAVERQILDGGRKRTCKK